MARLHSYYISNAHKELNYAGKNLSEENFNQIMKDYTNSLIFDENMFEENDNDVENNFENLIPDEEEAINSNPLNDENGSNLLVGDLINLNHIIGETVEPENVDHGDLNYNIDEILASANSS